MSIQNKLDEATKATEKSEKKLVSSLKNEYQKALDDIRNKLAKSLEKYGSEDKFTYAEMVKYNRLKTLEAQILKGIDLLSRSAEALTDGHLAYSYELNYYYVGYAVETEAQAKLAYSLLDKRAIKEAIFSPLKKIALENNAKSMKQKIRSSLTQGIIQGEGMQKIAARIKKDLESNANNAFTIAQTETTRVMNSARNDSYTHAASKGVRMKKVWLTSGKSNVRHTHARLDGEKVPLNMRFGNGLMYPGEPTGDAKEVINCHCTTIVELDGHTLENSKRRAKDGIVSFKTFEDWQENRLSK